MCFYIDIYLLLNILFDILSFEQIMILDLKIWSFFNNIFIYWKDLTGTRKHLVKKKIQSVRNKM